MPCLPLLLAFAFAADPPDEGFTYPPIEREGMNARLSVRVDPADEEVSAPTVLLTVTVTGPPTLEVESRLDDSTADWQATPASSWVVEGSQVAWQTTYRLRQAKPGAVGLPAVKARFRASPLAAWWEATWTDILKEARAAPGPTPLESPAEPRGRPVLLAVAVSLVGALLALVVWLRGRRRSRPPPSAEDVANAAFDRIEQMHTNDRAILVDLADVVRQYIAARYAIPAPRQTTEEFLAAAATRVPAEWQAELSDLLRRCDLAKFAHAPMEPDECRQLLARARLLVDPRPNNALMPRTG